MMRDRSGANFTTVEAHGENNGVPFLSPARCVSKKCYLNESGEVHVVAGPTLLIHLAKVQLRRAKASEHAALSTNLDKVYLSPSPTPAL